MLAAVTFRRLRSRGDFFCLCASGVFFGYILLRSLTSPIAYAARPDLYCVLAALAVYGVTILLSNATFRLTIIVSLLALAIVHVLIGIVQFTRGDNFMLIPFLQRANYGYRASGFIVCPNHLAGLLEVLGVFGLSIACWSRWPLWSKLLVGYVAGVCYAGVAMTGSRGGYLSVAASLIVFAILGLCVLGAAGKSLVLRFGIAGLAALIAVLIATAWLFHSSAVLSERAGTIIDRKISVCNSGPPQLSNGNCSRSSEPEAEPIAITVDNFVTRKCRVIRSMSIMIICICYANTVRLGLPGFCFSSMRICATDCKASFSSGRGESRAVARR